MNTLYVTYRQHGLLKRAVLNQSQYERYLADPKINDLTIHASQAFMEQAFNNEKGYGNNSKMLLKG